MSTDLHQPSTQPPVGAPDHRPTSVAAVVGLVGSGVCWPVGLVASIIGLLHTRGGAKKGRGMALAGVIISGVTAVVTVVVLVLGVQAFTDASSSPQLTDAGRALQEAQDADEAEAATATGTATDDAAAPPDASALDPWDDVVLDTCEHDDTGALTASVTVINPTEATASYTVVVGFDDAQGDVMGRASGQVSGVVPGGDAQVDLVGVGTDLPDDMECYVDDVVRLPA